MSQPFQSSSSRHLEGQVRVPGDKSISHRSLILGAHSTGLTRVEGLLESTDVLATAEALKRLGVPVLRSADGWEIRGRGAGGLSPPESDLDFGNSGTAVRLMMGVLAGHGFSARLTGDESLCRRPMGRVLEPLRRMGLATGETADDRLPLVITGTTDLVPIEYHMPVPSAQVKSAVLLAGLHTPGTTTVIERAATRDHTERMLRHFGADISVEERNGARSIAVTGGRELTGSEVRVPGDPSSAAFLAGAALIKPGSEIVIENILVNPTRIGFYITLREMGAELSFENERTEGGEPVADIRVRSGRLRGVTVPAERAPTMIDEYPCLAAVAALAEGETRMEGLAELRVKESDRLRMTSDGLAECGVANRIEGECLIVGGADAVSGGGVIKTDMDHRIAMSFLMLGVASKSPIIVDDVTMIDTSFPEFIGLMNELGATLEPCAGGNK